MKREVKGAIANKNDKLFLFGDIRYFDDDDDESVRCSS
jgi:hypothetical protein